MTSCENAGIAVLGQKDLRKFRYSNKKAIASTHVNSGIRWFDVTIDLAFDKEKVKKSDWIRAIKNNESYVTLKDGTLGVLPSKWIEQVKKILAVAEIEKEAVKISKYRFNIIEDIFEDIDDQELLQELHDKKKKFLDLDFKKKHKVPKAINAELRDYQYAGYQWLKFLDESEFGGILADDMGLGKTLQVLCLLANQKKKGTSLVIVPRTLLYNWSAEIERFCPSLKYAIHHGIKRATELSDYKKTDVIISTYGTVLSDISKFKEEDFNYIILDESQAIKNPNSLRYKAMKLLNARNKLAMTGTPIENNTMDLYAQLNFVVPGLLGSMSHFKKNFTVPIDNRGNAEAAELLRKLIRPFMLRRTKEQVAKDLPDKTESIIYCEMGAAQRKLYEELKEKIRQDVHSKVAESGVAKSKFFMLDGLLRLRQLCNSPLLVNSAFTGANAKSTKIDLLCERLSQNIEDRNTLIFSQFVGLLTIVKKELDKRKITYAYLDGSTRNRKAEVDKFMNNEDIKVFIISIKAGNTGMNLTKADYVYILDPWWNPAVEAQAIDRTHRIGQDKKVFAYKLICKDTIEEKIIQLQERKKNLAKDIIQVDENILKSLNKTDLLALFD
jgi:SNF2 family DNA or RNA helicase